MIAVAHDSLSTYSGKGHHPDVCCILDKNLFAWRCARSWQVTQMAKYLTSVYVSGWQCSSTASTSNEPGPDVADYPYDTVPNKAEIGS